MQRQRPGRIFNSAGYVRVNLALGHFFRTQFFTIPHSVIGFPKQGFPLPNKSTRGTDIQYYKSVSVIGKMDQEVLTDCVLYDGKSGDLVYCQSRPAHSASFVSLLCANNGDV